MSAHVCSPSRHESPLLSHKWPDITKRRGLHPGGEVTGDDTGGMYAAGDLDGAAEIATVTAARCCWRVT
ncbi:hypothetical protein [Streptomyces sp. S.PB5]|uniref:hypothetical protein n=1 Tax=Streptomyces sp. S.PB5 TaxID=3020844 RepID=UPI0025B04618|nr:hypothetical protein [Streptomyces sp. S.PB5]MDN3023599.1 hypothetical protein [Streptomyces sp. S.PB5]